MGESRTGIRLMSAGIGIAALTLALGVFVQSRADDRSLAAEQPSAGTAERRASPAEIRAYLNDMFDRLDRNASGYIEPAEAPRRQVISVREADGAVRELALNTEQWLARGDGDRDGRVDRAEYFSRLVPPAQSISGVPTEWRPREIEPRQGGPGPSDTNRAVAAAATATDDDRR